MKNDKSGQKLKKIKTNFELKQGRLITRVLKLLINENKLNFTPFEHIFIF